MVLEPSSGKGETVVVTVRPSHEVFDAWIAPPELGWITASEVHRVVEYRRPPRYDLVVGYTNVAGLAELFPQLPDE